MQAQRQPKTFYRLLSGYSNKMYLCYIDESGNTGNNLKDELQPYLVLVALMIPPQNIKEIEEDVRSLGYKYFGAESRNTDFEFHGDAIYNARKKNRYFHKLPLEKRLIFSIRSLMSYCDITASILVTLP